MFTIETGWVGQRCMIGDRECYVYTRPTFKGCIVQIPGLWSTIAFPYLVTDRLNYRDALYEEMGGGYSDLFEPLSRVMLYIDTTARELLDARSIDELILFINSLNEQELEAYRQMMSRYDLWNFMRRSDDSDAALDREYNLGYFDSVEDIPEISSYEVLELRCDCGFRSRQSFADEDYDSYEWALHRLRQRHSFMSNGCTAEDPITLVSVDQAGLDSVIAESTQQDAQCRANGYEFTSMFDE